MYLILFLTPFSGINSFLLPKCQEQTNLLFFSQQNTLQIKNNN